MVNWFNIRVFIPEVGLDFNGIFSVSSANNILQFFNQSDTNTNILLFNPNPTGNQFIGDNFTLDGTYISKTILPQDFPVYNRIQSVKLWIDEEYNRLSVKISGIWNYVEAETFFEFSPASDPTPPPPSIEQIVSLPIRDTRAHLGGKRAIAYLGINSFSNRQLRFDRRHFRP